jgi:hypothetical protein
MEIILSAQFANESILCGCDCFTFNSSDDGTDECSPYDCIMGA